MFTIMDKIFLKPGRSSPPLFFYGENIKEGERIGKLADF